MADGLLMVYTGNGPENNPSPLGQVFRALGRGLRVCVIAFGKESYGIAHLASEESLGSLLEYHPVGIEHHGDSIPSDSKSETTLQALQLVKEMVLSRNFQMIFLDRFTDLPIDNCYHAGDLVEILSKRPANLNVLVSGKSLPAELIDAADLVTRVQEIKGKSGAANGS